MKKLKENRYLIKICLLALGIFAIVCAAGCESQFAAPFDFNNLYYEYSLVSTGNEQYIVITKHIVSQTDVTIPDTIYDIPVREIGESAFAGETNLQSVTFGSNIRAVGANSFGGCTALQSISFSVSASDIRICEYAFTDCTGLQSVEIPENVTSIGRGAFYGCTALNKLTLPDSLSDIGGRAFAGTKWLKAQSQKNDFVTVGDGVLIAYNGDQYDVTLPKRVKVIAGAFAGNTKVETVKLTSNVTCIGDMAFMGCESLTGVNIPGSITDIGDGAFYGCTGLKRLILKKNIERIGSDAFTCCGASIYVVSGSPAEQYCTENGIEYMTLS